MTSSAIFAEDAPATAQAPAPAPKAVWLDNYDDALAQAKSANKRVLIDFTGSDWCHYCKLMDKEVLSTQKFADYASKNLVLLLVDFPRTRKLPKLVAERNEVLARVMHVQGFPTFVVLDPNGDELTRLPGYLPGGPDHFIAFLKSTENKTSTAK